MIKKQLEHSQNYIKELEDILNGLEKIKDKKGKRNEFEWDKYSQARVSYT